MRVAIDARRLQDDPLQGVGRGIANVLPHLAGDAQVTLLLDRRRPTPEAPGCRLVSLSGIGNLPEPAWLNVSVARWLHENPMLFHGVYNAIPYLASTPSVVTIHDLAWEHHPEDYRSAAQRAVIRAQARFAARRARMVVTVSQFARASILDTYGLDPEQVVVAPNAVDPIFSPDRAAEGRELLRGKGVTDTFVVALGGARRRALPVAVDAWKLATVGLEPRPQLVVVGAEEPPRTAGVVHLGRLDDRDWPGVLAAASVFCFPTRYEGFGMPALEAAASGTPVVCPRTGPLPEVLDDAAEWCDSPQEEDVAQGLRRLLDDPERRESLAQKGLDVAMAAPTWADSAAVLLAAYRRADD
jgi:glycosyltransferase involved in cell wall biosynthesis